MKRLVIAAVLLASCAVSVQKPVQTAEPRDPEPPAWVSQFAKAFCTMDATVLAQHLSPLALDIPPDVMDDFTADELRPFLPNPWPCVSVARYLGYGEFGDGSMEWYFRFDMGDHSPAYGFIVSHDKVIRID